MIAAAEAWRALAVQYAEAATELVAYLATVQSGIWQGVSAEEYVAAHQPFLAWLTQTSELAQRAALSHDAAAAGYAAALATMPTLAELAANHAVHGALVATNFLGINTIPIAVNEADYVRMWLQAATTMSVYEAMAAESVASTPSADPAPQIMSADSGVTARAATQSTSESPVNWIIRQVRESLQELRKLANNLPEPLRSVVTQVIDSFSSFANGSGFSIIAHSVLDPLIYMGPFTPVFAPAAATASVAAVAAGQSADVEPELAQPVPVQSAETPARTWPAAVGTAPLSVNAPVASTGTTSPPAPSAPSAPAAQPVAAQGYFYAVGAGPGGSGFSPTTGARSGAGLPSAAEAGIASHSGVRADVTSRGRARRRARGYKDERMMGDGRMTLTADGTDQPAVTVSARGMAGLGFAGTVTSAADLSARGVTRADDDARNDMVTEPMLPQTWPGREADR